AFGSQNSFCSRNQRSIFLEKWDDQLWTDFRVAVEQEQKSRLRATLFSQSEVEVGSILEFAADAIHLCQVIRAEHKESLQRSQITRRRHGQRARRESHCFSRQKGCLSSRREAIAELNVGSRISLRSETLK